MTITIELLPEETARLAADAYRRGLSLEEYVSHRLSDHETENDTPAKRPLPKKRHRRPYNPVGLVAALESFEQRDAEEQRRTLRYLETAIDRDRPGQRRIFGPGINPMPTDEAA